MQTDEEWAFQRYAETLEKATELYADYRQLLRHAPLSAVNPDHESRRSINRFSAVEFCADYDKAIAKARKRVSAGWKVQAWSDYLHYLLAVAGMAESKLPAKRWRDLVSVFGRALYQTRLHPYDYFRKIKRRLPA